MNEYYLIQNKELNLVAMKMGPIEQREEFRCDLIEEHLEDVKYYRRNLHNQ